MSTLPRRVIADLLPIVRSGQLHGAFDLLAEREWWVSSIEDWFECCCVTQHWSKDIFDIFVSRLFWRIRIG